MRIHIKSKFGADFRRYSVVAGTGIPLPTYEEFIEELFKIHKLTSEQRQSVTISYSDKDGTNLPISNNDNLYKALKTTNNLRINLQNKGESYEEQFGYGLSAKTLEEKKKKRSISISSPQDFRRVSSILDADTLPTELRRVQLCKNYSNKPLGFYIRNGSSFHWTATGPAMTSGIFISRLLPHGLAASTNLLTVNDEILEVNGIKVQNKTLDQVTDIMLANATNLILTTRPAVYHPYQGYYNSMPPSYGPTSIFHPLDNISPPLYHPMNYGMYYPPISPRHPGYPGHFVTHVPPHHLYNQENLDDKYNMSSPIYNFSRESTFRLSASFTKSDKIKDPRSPRRPMSMYPGWLPPQTNDYHRNKKIDCGVRY